MSLEITKDNLNELLNKNEIVVLDFWADWCGPCKMFAPTFEKIASQYPDVVFGKVNTEIEQELASQFQIRSIPTLAVFRQNILLFEQAGALPEQALKKLIEDIKGLDMEMVKKEIEEQETA